MSHAACQMTQARSVYLLQFASCKADQGLNALAPGTLKSGEVGGMMAPAETPVNICGR